MSASADRKAAHFSTAAVAQALVYIDRARRLTEVCAAAVGTLEIEHSDSVAHMRDELWSAFFGGVSFEQQSAFTPLSCGTVAPLSFSTQIKEQDVL